MASSTDPNTKHGHQNPRSRRLQDVKRSVQRNVPGAEVAGHRGSRAAGRPALRRRSPRPHVTSAEGGGGQAAPSIWTLETGDETTMNDRVEEIDRQEFPAYLHIALAIGPKSNSRCIECGDGNGPSQNVGPWRRPSSPYPRAGTDDWSLWYNLSR